MDGGIITNQASHHIDLLQYMMGDVESVHAMSTTALVDIQAEDTAVANVRFKNGALGVIEATGATRPNDLEGSLSVLGEMGSVVIGGFAVNKMETWSFVDKNAKDEEVVEKYSVNPPNVYGFGHQEYYEHVVDVIENNLEKYVDGYEGRKSLEIITSIYESVETGKAIKLPVSQSFSKLGIDYV